MNRDTRCVKPEGTLINQPKHCVRARYILTTTNPIHTDDTLTTVKKIFLRDKNHIPLFIYSQKTPGRPKVNQLRNSAA
jgi:hypothetical protein